MLSLLIATTLVAASPDSLDSSAKKPSQQVIVQEIRLGMTAGEVRRILDVQNWTWRVLKRGDNYIYLSAISRDGTVLAIGFLQIGDELRVTELRRRYEASR
jgi:hypothetical protein